MSRQAKLSMNDITFDSPGLPIYSVGIDAGGTKTRVAVAVFDGATTRVVLDFDVAAMHGMMLATDAGTLAVESIFAGIAAAITQAKLPYPTQLSAGITGYDNTDSHATAQLMRIVSTQLRIDTARIELANDVQSAFYAHFEIGAGYLLYAGTGSIAVYIDLEGKMHQAGGRGGWVGDDGGAFWITSRALKHIWRREDEIPDAWRDSALATAIFEDVGGSQWNFTRQFAARNDRGEIGLLARAVARAANAGDADALRILTDAGVELARLANALTQRFGVRPISMTGGAFRLHRIIAETVRAALPSDARLTQREIASHIAAAKRAAFLKR
jgi:glucosamine kinase